MKRIAAAAAAAGFALVLSAGSAMAYTFDSEAGTGFVGKGEVQLALNYNNKQLQDNAASLQFASVSTVVTERTWICTNSNNQSTQERERTTTTSIQGVLESVARERNQITGFTLSGYDGTPTSSSTTAGNQLNSCPGGPWTLTTPAGDPEVISSTSALTVNDVPLG
jgi:hypothetical protein